MSSWYYLVAQLPSLSLDTEVPMPITEEYFLELASRFLDKKSLKTLSELTLEPPKEVSKVSSTLVKNGLILKELYVLLWQKLELED